MDSAFIAFADGYEFDNDDDKDALLARVAAHFEEKSGEGPLTVTVENAAGELLAWRSNRRIIGRFFKQEWGGRKNDYAIEVGTEEFDGTDAILLMPLTDIHELQDSYDSTDDIGRRFVDWAGPFSVHIIDSIVAFFGVLDADDITQHHLDLARAHCQPEPQETETVELTVKVTAYRSKGASWADFARDALCNVQSKTQGIVVQHVAVAGDA